MPAPDEGLTWAELRVQVAERVGDGDARRIIEEVSGAEPGEWLALGDRAVTARQVARADQLTARRAAGEPLQYVLGRWGFRRLDLWVDPRALIPRPETEVVAGLAIAAAGRVAADEGRDVRVVDLGTGTGAIGLSVADEVPRSQVVVTDADAGALDVARANLAGLGRPATRVEVRQGSWFAALDPQDRGSFDVVVSNPPYVAEDEELPPVVADWEPASALRSGADGTDALAELIAEAPSWLTVGGVLVLELAPQQAVWARDAARAAGFGDVAIERDLAGRDRALVAEVDARARHERQLGGDGS